MIIVREQGKGTVDTILPRRNALIRPAVANVDVLVVLASCAIPQTEPFLIDRILTIAARQDVPCLVCVNKDDLAPAAPLAEIYRKAGIPTIVTSAATGEGIETLRAQIAGKFAVFTGNSGVGKSSVLNALAPELALPVGEVSQKLGRGRHTTRHIELFSLPGGTYIADTPGFSSFDTDRMDAIPKEELAQTFVEFLPYLGQCQFPDCAHRKEPGCAIRAAVEQGAIGKSRYESYLRLYDIVKDHKPWES